MTHAWALVHAPGKLNFAFSEMLIRFVNQNWANIGQTKFGDFVSLLGHAYCKFMMCLKAPYDFPASLNL